MKENVNDYLRNKIGVKTVESDSKLCGIEGMRLGSSSIVDNKIN
jgi:hypothetical protein